MPASASNSRNLGGSSKTPGIMSALLKRDGEKYEHPAWKYRSRYDFRKELWKFYDKEKNGREIESNKMTTKKQFNSVLQREIDLAFDIIDHPGESGGDTSRQLAEHIGKKEAFAHKIMKLKKRQDFRMTGLPRPISLHTLNQKG